MRGVGIAAVVAVALATATTVVASLWPLVGWAMVERARQTRDPGLIVSAASAGQTVWFAAFAAILAAFVMVVIWSHRARRNLDAVPEARPALSSGWAIAGWFVPFANLVVPYLVMADIARTSLSRPRTPIQVVAWWSGWLVFWSGWIGELVCSYVRYAHAEPSFGWFDYGNDALFRRLIGEYQRQLIPGSLMAVGIAVAGVALITLVRRISNAQQAGLAET
mgnify:CR=1 FL=1